GRFLLGIGTGWFREEAEIMGVDYDHRWTQAREHVLAMKELWTKDEAEFHGTYLDFPQITCNPKPTQKPHPPVLLGGGAKNVHRRVVQWGDGWLPVGADPETIKSSRATLSELADTAGRDPRSVSITVLNTEPPDRDLMDRYEEAGADRVILLSMAPDHAGAMSEIEDLAAKVLR
ncbi:MAG: LLM class flavin-dependent oxidoreductase, partial [Dehalococcoidia bacterium]